MCQMEVNKFRKVYFELHDRFILQAIFKWSHETIFAR